MASLSKTMRNGRNYFRCQFFTNGKRHAVYLGSIKESAPNKSRARIDDLETSVKLRIKPDKTSQEWIQTADWTLIQKLDSLGLCEQVESLIANRRQIESGMESPQRPTPLVFFQWYINQRKADCEKSTVEKIPASLNQLCDYCREVETTPTIADLTPEVAFRFQLYRQQS